MPEAPQAGCLEGSLPLLAQASQGMAGLLTPLLES